MLCFTMVWSERSGGAEILPPLKTVGAKHAEIMETTGRSGGHLQPPVLRKDQLPPLSTHGVVTAQEHEAWTKGRQCWRPCRDSHLSSLACRQGPHGGDWIWHRRHRHRRCQEAEGEVPRVQSKLGGRAAHWERWLPQVFLPVLSIKTNPVVHVWQGCASSCCL